MAPDWQDPATVPALPQGRRVDAAFTDFAPSAGDGSLVGRTIGPFEVVSLLGEGGMGAVYLATQRSPVERQVALKVMRAPFASRDARLRFEAERQALARLSHPYVAQLYEAGTTDDGLAYFAMERVVGQPIVEACDARGLGIRERLELFVGVCEGVQHAHQKGIIHRDLKPSNVLVGEVEGRLWPKVIDFGIAKALDDPLTDATLLTGAKLIGTPAYMSPESLDLALGRLDPDTRSDVYALGLVLYELLVGEHPFEIRERSFARLARRVDDDEAPSLCARLAKLPEAERDRLASARGLAPAEHLRVLGGDLEWIVARAIARDREQRYGGAAEVAAELRRYLAGEPVLAGPPSPWYRLGKLVRRHRLTVAAASVALVALVTGGLTSALLGYRASREAAAARAARAEAEEVARFLGDTFRVAAPVRARGATITARELLERGRERIDRHLREQPQLRRRMLSTLAQAYQDLGLYAQAESLLREALPLAEAMAVEGDDRALAEVLLRLGEAVDYGGRRAEAKPLYRRALALQDTGGRADAVTGSILNALAVVLRFEGDAQGAAVLHRRALALAGSLGDGGRGIVARATYLLAYVDYEAGRWQQAEAGFVRAVSLFEALNGADDYTVVGPLRGLADLYGETNRFALAEPLYKRALAISERVVGPDSPALAASYNNLGASYWSEGRLAEARDCWERALAIDEAALGPSHRETGYPVLNLGLVAWKQGDLGRAEALLARAAAIFEPSIDPADPTWGWLEWGRGQVALARNDLAAAERHLRRAHEIRSAVLPAGHRERVQSATDLAAVLDRLGKTAEAAALGGVSPSRRQSGPRG